MDKFTVRNLDGSVDVLASVSAYSTALVKWVQEYETPVDAIEAAVEAVFDSHDGRIPMPALLSKVVNQLATDPEQFKTLTDRCRDYMKSQAHRFETARGKGGGVKRLTRPDTLKRSA